MDLDIILSIAVVVFGITSIFSRQPFFSIFSYSLLVITMAIVLITNGTIIHSSILILSIGSVLIIYIVQMFMKIDLEKEFQNSSKMEIVPMFGIVIVAILLGIFILTFFSTPKLYSNLNSNSSINQMKNYVFQSYESIATILIISSIGIVTTVGLLIDNIKKQERL